jgi:hypothetical protein
VASGSRQFTSASLAKVAFFHVRTDFLWSTGFETVVPQKPGTLYRASGPSQRMSSSAKASTCGLSTLTTRDHGATVLSLRESGDAAMVELRQVSDALLEQQIGAIGLNRMDHLYIDDVLAIVDRGTTNLLSLH